MNSAPNMDTSPPTGASVAAAAAAASRAGASVSLFKRDGGPDPARLHSFSQHWPSILPIVRKLISNEPNISPGEWQNLFHDIHMVCSWDTKGCVKLIEALEDELSVSQIARTRTRLASIHDGQLQLREYIECWSDYRRLCKSIPSAFQQLDLAAKELFPQPRLPSSPSAEHPSPGKSGGCGGVGRDGPVKSLLLRLWDHQIVEPFERQLAESKQDNNNTPAKQESAMDSRCPELLANYCDLILRRNSFSKKFSPQDILDRFMGILAVLKFVRDKEAFLRFYHYHLMRRLIHDDNLDLALESSFVEFLREVPKMPGELTNKFFRMIRDARLSEERQAQMESESGIELRNRPDEPSVRVKVLNPGAWCCNLDNYSIRLPESLRAAMKKFEIMYDNQANDGKHLDWCSHLSNGTINFKTNHGKYKLQINTAQLAILSELSRADPATRSLAELAEATELSSRELRKNLWSLMSNRNHRPIVVCEPKLTSNATDFGNETRKFSINHDFAMVKGGNIKSQGRLSLIGQLPIKFERDLGYLGDAFNENKRHSFGSIPSN